jgi:tetratricopeptide (TPR) repeat protein
MDDVSQLLSAGVESFENGDYNTAIKNFEEAISKNHSLIQAWNNRGLAFLYLGKYEDALQSFDEALSIDSNYENAQIAKRHVLEILAKQKITPNKIGKTSSIQPAEIKSTFLAVVASFFIPGLGQIYCRRIARGIIILVGFIFSWLLAFGIFIFSVVTSPVGTSYNIYGFIFPSLVWVWDLFDVYALAKKINARGIE